MHEAEIKDTETGRVAQDGGWFILNVGDIGWYTLPDGGTWCSFESPNAHNEQVGIGVHILWPGQTPGKYHAESTQEGFLVLAGECLVIVEGQERHMRQWDYFHCPPGTAHITVGTGDGPCAILMMGARGGTTDYIVEPLAARFGASVAQHTQDSKEAYADRRGTITPARAPWPPETWTQTPQG
jgi:uncharacterized cupin superfamily protein